jgi:N-formylmaleamate deformylase
MTPWTEGDIHTPNLSVHYYRTGGAAKRTPLLLLHGVTNSALYWTRVARAFEADYDVVMTDARGHGASDPINGVFDVDTLASDAAAVINELDLDRPIVFGHSMGGVTAAVLAAQYPHLVRALVLEDPPMGDGAPLVQTGPEELEQVLQFKALPREQQLAIAAREHPTWSPDDLIPWSDGKAQFDVAVLQHSAIFRDVPWRDVLSRIHCPTLLLTGDPHLGALISPELAQEAADLIEHATVVRIPDAGHSIHRDRLDDTVRLVRDFFAHLTP